MLPLPTAPSDLAGKRILVMGLGTKGGGTEVVKWLVVKGAHVLVTDTKTEKELASSLAELRGLPVDYALGGHREEDFRNADLIVRNPAVPLGSPFLRIAADHGVPWVMDVTLFFSFCPAPIAGVTGTRGKSTSVAVAGEILRRAFPDTVIAGNIGRSPLGDLDRITPTTKVVLELSSWQLEGLEMIKKSPHWTVLTTILPDHLNRYPSMEAYVAAKEIIVKYQRVEDSAVLPIDDPWGDHFARLTPARKLFLGLSGAGNFTYLRKKVKNSVGGIIGGRGTDGLFRIGSAVVWRHAGHDVPVLAWSEIGGTGDHTKRNMLAGALLALEMGAGLDDARAVLREFRGLPNRLETVGERDGRTFVNDTTATTPDAVIAALRAFADRRVVLIAGGTDKNLDYTVLARVLTRAENLRTTVLLAGSATEKLLSALRAKNTAPVRTMAEAVAQAWRLSQPGDVILLSPGAASFELFLDEFDRGEQFRAAVRALGTPSKAS